MKDPELFNCFKQNVLCVKTHDLKHFYHHDLILRKSLGIPNT